MNPINPWLEKHVEVLDAIVKKPTFTLLIAEVEEKTKEIQRRVERLTPKKKKRWRDKRGLSRKIGSTTTTILFECDKAH